MPGDHDRARLARFRVREDFLERIPVATRPLGQAQGGGQGIDDVALRARPLQDREPGPVLVRRGRQGRLIEGLGRLDQAATALGCQEGMQVGDQCSIHANES